MRVAVLTHEPFFPPTGGGSAEALYLVQEMVQRGHQVHVFCPRVTDVEGTKRRFAIEVSEFVAWRMGRYASFRNFKYLAYPWFLERLVAQVARKVAFDVVLSTFGVMFTPDHERASQELVRVCRPGGRIGLANWTPTSYIGQLFKTIGKYVPPASGTQSPALWGTEERLNQLFGGSARSVHAVSREFVFRYRSPAHWIDVFRTFYGPMNKTFGALDANRQAAFTLDLLGLMERRNRSGDRTLVLPSEYLEVVIERA